MAKQTEHVHFIGVGGIGMSALAQWYLAQGYSVSGSDSNKSEITDFLSGLGVKINIGHDAQNIGAATKVIHSAAIKPGNPEYDEAEKKQAKTLLYAEALGEITKRYDTIAIAGTHGKSTTTAMVAKILIDAGLDPTVIVGTKMRELEQNNFRAGQSKWLVLEADEYNRHFHHYYPKIAVINNIELDHSEIYPTLEQVEQSFLEFMDNVDPGGVLIANGQDKSVTKTLQKLDKKDRTITIFNKSDLAKHELSVPGAHNRSNAEAAFQVGKALGLDEAVLHDSLLGFKGVWRRLEEVAEGIYSDYGHHPTEIRANLQALREANPDKKIVCVFQPHQRERLTRLFDEFVGSLDLADLAIVVPLYEARGRDIEQGKESQDLVSTIGRDSVLFAPDFNAAYDAASKLFDTEHLVVFMGAGDIDENLRAKLAEQHLID